MKRLDATAVGHYLLAKSLSPFQVNFQYPNHFGLSETLRQGKRSARATSILIFLVTAHREDLVHGHTERNMREWRREGRGEGEWLL